VTNLYPAEFRERALRRLAEARHGHPSDFAAASHLGGRLGVDPKTLRLWKKRADVDTGRKLGMISEAPAKIKLLKKQIAKLEKANEILRSASVFFATELGQTSSKLSPPST
jgi:transposase